MKVFRPSFMAISLFILASFVTMAQSAEDFSLSEKRQQELLHLLKQDCGSCHGMTMKGGLGPALTPEVLSSKPRQMIEMTIRHGRPGTPMPPWSPILSKEEISWLVDTLYSGVRQ